MPTIMSTSSPDGARTEYVAVASSRGELDEAIRGIRLANPRSSVSFRAPHMENGRFKAIGWCDAWREEA